MEKIMKRLNYVLSILELQRPLIDFFAKEVLPYRKSDPIEYFRRLDVLADNYERTGNLRLKF